MSSSTAQRNSSSDEPTPSGSESSQNAFVLVSDCSIMPTPKNICWGTENSMTLETSEQKMKRERQEARDKLIADYKIQRERDREQNAKQQALDKTMAEIAEHKRRLAVIDAKLEAKYAALPGMFNQPAQGQPAPNQPELPKQSQGAAASDSKINRTFPFPPRRVGT